MCTFKKWRTIVDGDTWFFVKAIPMGEGYGCIGVSRQGEGLVKIYVARGSSECIVRITKNQALEMVRYIKECHEKAKLIRDVSDWGKEGTYVIHELITETGLVIHISSWTGGEVHLKFILYDNKGEDYYQSAITRSCYLKMPALEQFLVSLEKAAN